MGVAFEPYGSVAGNRFSGGEHLLSQAKCRRWALSVAAVSDGVVKVLRAIEDAR
jgi:hypothetical protein